MTYDASTLLKLLPELYGLLDGDDGPLQELLEVLAGPAEEVDRNIGQLYEDIFIETCDEWVIPYIGNLLGVSSLHTVEGSAYSQRGWVGNAIARRRRKGTVSMLRQLAQDVTGRPATAVEMFQILAWTQHLNHVRPVRPQTCNVRDSNALQLTGSAFMSVASTADIRPIESCQGMFNIPNIGIFLWRLKAYRLVKVTARAAEVERAYAFNPLGLNTPLFNDSHVEIKAGSVVSGASTEAEVPGRLRRRFVYEALENLRQSGQLDGADSEIADALFTESTAIFSIYQGDTRIPWSQIAIGNLETWEEIPDGAACKVMVDPQCGRLRFATNEDPAGEVQVTYNYGFSSEIGGGPYDRSDLAAAAMPSDPDWTRCVRADTSGAADEFETLQDAIAAWNATASNEGDDAVNNGLIVVLDSHTYAPAEDSATDELTIEFKEGRSLAIIAARWEEPDSPNGARDPSKLDFTSVRPHIKWNLKIQHSEVGDEISPGSLVFSGFLFEGQIEVEPRSLNLLQLADCTVYSIDGNSLDFSLASSGDPAANPDLEVRLDRCIVGSISVPGGLAELRMSDSIIDGLLSCIESPLVIERCTITGKADPRELEASDCIFMDKVAVKRKQTGCVRFSYVPEDSEVPRAYRCQPSMALASAGAGDKPAVAACLKPAFVSKEMSNPAYMQLADGCAPEILTGASNGDEMGVFNSELNTLRETNLRSVLSEQLKAGLSAGIFHST